MFLVVTAYLVNHESCHLRCVPAKTTPKQALTARRVPPKLRPIRPTRINLKPDRRKKCQK